MHDRILLLKVLRRVASIANKDGEHQAELRNLVRWAQKEQAKVDQGIMQAAKSQAP